MKITITNAYTYHNKGDSGILLATIDLLKQIYGEKNLEINVLSFTPKLDKKIYYKDKCVKEVNSNVLNPRIYKKNIFGKKFTSIKLGFRLLYLIFMIIFNKKGLVKKEKTFELIDSSDLILVCGGGFLGGKKLSSLIHLVQIKINTIFNSRVIIMPTSIEPLENKLLKKITEKTLKKVDFIMARENITFEYLKTFIDKEKISLTPDMAFLLKEKKYSHEKINNFKKNHKYIVGLTVRNWNFPNSQNQNKSMDNYINEIKDFIIHFVNKENIGFVFIPQVIVPHGNDIDVAKKIHTLLPAKIKRSFLILKDDIEPSQIKYIIGQMDYFIGTRMHSNIFALSLSVPTLAISYEKKTNGIMSMIKQEEYIVDIDSITKDELINKFSKLIKNSEKIKLDLQNNTHLLKKQIENDIKKVIKKE